MEQVYFASPAEVEAWRQAGSAVVVDVRERPEWDQVRIPGAILMPLSHFDPGAIPDPAGRHLVFHCKSGVRCGTAAEKAVAAGFKGRIARMQGGILAWMRAGYATEEG